MIRPLYNTACKAWWLALCMAVTSCLTTVQAQQAQSAFGHYILFELNTITSNARINEPVYTLISDTAVYRIFDKLQAGPQEGVVKNIPKSPLLLGVKLHPSLTKYNGNIVHAISKTYTSYQIADTSDAILIAMGITPANKAQFQYHVVMNDSVELVPWSPVTTMEQLYGAKQPYALLGSFKAPGNVIMVEVVDKRDYSIHDGVLFDWHKDVKPVLEQITVGMQRDYFNLAYLARNRQYATRFDPQTGVPLNFTFPQDSVGQLLIQLEKRPTVAYAGYLLRERAGEKDTLTLDMVSAMGQLVLNKSLYNRPGHYELRVEPQARIPVWNEANMLSIPFEVLPSQVATGVMMRQVWPWMAGVLALVALLFAAYRQYSRRLVRKESQQRSKVQLALKSIRSQLNPHFMFNALGSIQNLMNKHQLLEANHYLAKFAGLTRQVLNTSERELISLEDELKIAADYLEMEQLRFGFQYRLQVAANINQANIEVPSMLLQPFIENAVKHGMVNQREKGLIIVEVQQQDHNLVFTIQDNGPGFNDEAATNKPGSFGLKLSRERIELINQMYKQQPASLQMASKPGNTTIILTLTNWT